MSVFLFLAAMSVLPAEIVPVEEELSASDVLMKCEAAYAGVKTYVGTTTVRTKSDIDGRAWESIATAKITFMRPGKILIEGRTASREPSGNGGDPFSLVSNGQKTWKHWAVQTNGGFLEVKSVPMAGMGGVTHGASERIPAALMRSDGGFVGGNDPFIVPRLSATKLAGHEKIEGADCYKLVANHPKLGDATLWIDSKYFFLRQMTREHNEAQLAASAKAGNEALQKLGKPLPAGLRPLKSKTDVYTFSIYQIDGPLSETLFADPTMK
jgi:outer membrane lipoprotein-sorting protein